MIQHEKINTVTKIITNIISLPSKIITNIIISLPSYFLNCVYDFHNILHI